MLPLKICYAKTISKNRLVIPCEASHFVKGWARQILHPHQARLHYREYHQGQHLYLHGTVLRNRGLHP